MRAPRTTFFRKIVFALIPVTLLLAGVELTLRVIGFRFSFWYLQSSIFEPVGGTGAGGSSIVRTAPMFVEDKPYGIPFCMDQTFARAKPPGTFRVVLVGESSVYRLGSAATLTERLQKGLQKPVQIINAGFQGCGSQRMLLSIEETVNFDPDVVVMYIGHNEFVSFSNPETLVDTRGQPKEQRPSDWRILQCLARISMQFFPPSRERVKGKSRYYSAVEKAEFYARFEQNLGRMVEVIQSRKILPVLGTISYNFAREPFFGSGAFTYDQACALSDAELNRQLALHPGEPFLEYARGARLAARGDFTSAREWYDRAFCDDPRPYRANTQVNAIIRKVAARPGVCLADVNGAVAAQSPNHLPDFSVFADHCHLNARGNEIWQETVAASIAQCVLAAARRSR